MQNARFGHFHPACRAGVVMVLALEVERTVYDEVGEVVRRAAAGEGRFAADHAESEKDFGGGRIEGENVGGLVAAAVASVQTLNQPVRGENNGRGRARGGRGTRRNAFGMWNCSPPGWVGDVHLDPRLRGATTSRFHHSPWFH